MSDTLPLEPTVEGKTFTEWVDELSQFTSRDTAQEQVRFMFGYGGDEGPVERFEREDTGTEADVS